MDNLLSPTPNEAVSPVAVALRIIEARATHVPAILEIYAHYVQQALCTFEEVTPTLSEMHRRLDRLRRTGLPWLIALEGEVVLGYAYASPYRSRSGYNGTVEDSIYVRQGQQGKGIGRQLLHAVLAQCRAQGYREMIAVVGDSANRASLALHRAVGFREVGVLRGVGRKFDRAVDTVLMQCSLAGTASERSGSGG